MSRVVENWFGEEFKELDPLLQDLHHNGGVLMGTVDIQYGKGLAKAIGKKLAPKLGLPLNDGEHELKVTISHSIDSLVWSRLFSNNHEMTSIFKPHGKQPEGYWSETTGKLSLELGVDVNEGGWYWVQRRVKFFGIPLPLFLFPSSKAYKKVENGQYIFSVVFSLPILGKLVGYSGALKKQ